MFYRDNNFDIKNNLQVQNCINIYNNVSLRLLNINSLDGVMKVIEESFYSIISPDFIDIFMKIDGTFSRMRSSNLDIYDYLFTIREPFPELLRQLDEERRIIFIEDFQSFEKLKIDLNIFGYIESKESIIIIPLIIKDILGGFLILAFNNKINYEKFNFDILIGICNLASLTIERLKYKEEQVLMKDVLDKSKKMTLMGQIVAGVAHEINNPLSILQLDIEELTQNLKSNKKKEMNLILNSMQEEIFRISNILKKLKEFYSPIDDNSEIFCPDDIIKDYPIKIFLKNIKKKNIKIQLGLDCKKNIRMPKTRFLEIIMNILNNAIDAVEQMNSNQGEISIKTYYQIEKNMNIIKISDNGIGMTTGILKKIFEPFFTAGKTGGTGLGLSISYSIIKKYDGEIEVFSKENEGTEFTLYFPGIEL